MSSRGTCVGFGFIHPKLVIHTTRDLCSHCKRPYEHKNADFNFIPSVSHFRARSIYERALQVDSKNATLYLKYVEMEMKHKNISLARNLFDRIVTILPRRDQFW